VGPMVWPHGSWPRAQAALDWPRHRARPSCPQEEGWQSRSPGHRRGRQHWQSRRPGHRRGRQQGVGDPKTENRIIICLRLYMSANAKLSHCPPETDKQQCICFR
jgi:hypothetical protein